MTRKRLDAIARRDVLAIVAGAAAATAATTPARSAAPPSLPPLPPRQHNAISGSGVPEVTQVVDTTSGRVQGLVHDAVQTFKGIRYGAPPVGALRWMPPNRPEPATAVLDCSEYGAPAMQMASGTTASPVTDFGMQMSQVFTTPSELKIQNEDCLFLNVWTPATDNGKRPVMFWIHGGGFAYGSGGQPIYCGEDLARDHNVVVVSVNHRLNIFGYLYLGAFGKPYESSGTVGMQDLVLALEWVRDNIANFGGDGGNVTIMGQSGGGAKVSILLSMESARGLFHKASIQSGAALAIGRKETAATATAGLLAELAIKAGDIKALRALPAQTLIAAANAAQAKNSSGPRMPGMPRGGGGFGFGPIVDGVAITRDPFTPDSPAVSNNVPILVGSVKDEITIFTAAEPWFGTMTQDQLKMFVGALGPKGPALVEAWRKIRPDYSPTYLFIAAVSSNFAFGSSITLAERKAAAHGAPVYMWYFTWETPVENGQFKSPHTIEIPFMLDSYRRVRAYVGPDPAAAQMAKQLSAAWVAFARTGNPDCKEIPHWPAYDASLRATMVFNLKSAVVNDPNGEVRTIVQGTTA
jgi:para-nitrobenzyl esterase